MASRDNTELDTRLRHESRHCHESHVTDNVSPLRSSVTVGRQTREQLQRQRYTRNGSGEHLVIDSPVVFSQQKLSKSKGLFLQVHLVCLIIALAALMPGLEGACKYKGKQICEGAVTKVTKKFVRVCSEGKVLKKKKEEVPPGYPMAGEGNNK